MNVQNIKIEHRNPSVQEFQQLRDSTNWFEIENEVVEQALSQSLFAVCVLHKDQIVASGRVIGDGALYFYIQDLIVLPDFRNKGIGKMIMLEIDKWIDQNANKNSFIGLMAADGVKEFYTAFGFREREADAPGMFKRIKK